MKSMLEKLSINSDELRQQRVNNAVSMAESASYSKIMSYRAELFDKINKIESIFDLGSTSTTDIGSNLIKFDAKEWASELYRDGNLVDLLEKVNNLNCRIKIHNSLFPNNKIDFITAEDYPGGVLELILNETEEKAEKKTKKKG